MNAIAIKIADPFLDGTAAGDAARGSVGVPARPAAVRRRSAKLESLRKENARLRRELRCAGDALAASSRQIGALHGAISGSLRQPLRAVSELMDSLSTELADAFDGPARDCFETLGAAARQADEQIDALLDASRMTVAPARREVVDLSGVAREIVLDLSWNHRGRPVEVVTTETVNAAGDASRLRMLMKILLENCWNRVAGQRQGCVRFAASSGDEGETIYSVSDNALEDRSREPVDTSRGLAVAAQIVRGHGGRLWSRGAADGGRAFCFTLG